MQCMFLTDRSMDGWTDRQTDNQKTYSNMDIAANTAETGE